MSEIMSEVLKNYRDKNIILFLKNNFRHEGKLLKFDEKNLVLEDRKVGVLVLRLEDIGSLRGGE